jgi:hypothetical protein
MTNSVQMTRSRLAQFVHLAHNAWSYVGLFLINTAAVLWLFVLPVYVREGGQHPYLSLFFIVALPMCFIGGFVLIPFGMWLRYRAEKRRGTYSGEFLALGFENRELRNMAVFVLGVTGFNVLVGGYFSHAAVKYMESPRFCGTTCHSMAPENIAFRDSPHRNVDCVECHIGSGRGAHVEAKLSGVRQMFGELLNNHSRPIPTPVHQLRPAREICEKCHWPQSFGGWRLHVLHKFALDEANTRTMTVLALHVGGGQAGGGIHGFHMDPGVSIEYLADPTRQRIPWVSYTDESGEVTEFMRADWDSTQAEGLERRTMDCLDCHTRPSHRFQVAGRALDAALARGDIDSTLPWVKRQSLEILRAGYESTEQAERRIPEALAEFYRTEHPDVFESQGAAIEQSAAALLAVYARNVFPEMAIDWGTYPDNTGHSDSPGCFRCHDGGHRTSDGTAINSDCRACHEILAIGEFQEDVMRRFGIEPRQ